MRNGGSHALLFFSLSVILALGLGLLISGASLADRDDDDARPARAQVLVLGEFFCRDFQRDGRRESQRCFAFQGWEGVGRFAAPPGKFEENQPICLFFEARGNVGETCRGLTQEIRSVAQALGCATGQIQVHEDPEGFGGDVPFTCSGRRDHVVGAMAEISRALLEFPL